MTQEQWLVYIWSIYPEGGFSVFYGVFLVVLTIVLLIITIAHFDSNEYEQSNTLYTKLGKWKFTIPGTLVLLLFLSNLVPSKEGFVYIMATPYVVESGKSLVESLDDNNSKLYKINQIMDNALDKALTASQQLKETK